MRQARYAPRRRLRTLRAGAYLGLLIFPAAHAIHHMKRAPLLYVPRQDDSKPLVLTNQCPEDIWPGIGTQGGTGPDESGFRLSAGDIKSLEVSANWQGRVWGRTNCSFNADGSGPDNNGGRNGGGQACGTGDCGGVMDCKMTGQTPVTLAEFTLLTSAGQDFYDLSLVDGYNLPLAIVALFPQSDNATLEAVPPNLTNPACVGTAALLGGDQDALMNTNASFPIPLERRQTAASLAGWCPWDLQLDPPDRPGDGVYPYPDDNIQRPAFDPCYSACSKNSRPEDCCTGAYGSPGTCAPNAYSRAAKAVCPDAYSYAFDDQTSTFIMPSGGGYEVVFCPLGRSTNILATLGDEMHTLASKGTLPKSVVSDLQNASFIKSREDSASSRVGVSWLVAATGVAALLWSIMS